MKTLADPSDLDATVARIKRVRSDSPRQWGRMSPGEMLCHCTDAFRVALGEVTFPSRAGFLRRTVLKWAVLYAPVTWPKNVPTGAAIDPTRSGTRPGELAADARELERMCHRFVLSKKQDAMVFHPFFGPLTDAEWLRWGYLHLDHHLRQFGV